jgi:hypothetical protein
MSYYSRLFNSEFYSDVEFKNIEAKNINLEEDGRLDVGEISIDDVPIITGNLEIININKAEIGDLIIEDNEIKTLSNQDINITPDGTGKTNIKNLETIDFITSNIDLSGDINLSNTSEIQFNRPSPNNNAFIKWNEVNEWFDVSDGNPSNTTQITGVKYLDDNYVANFKNSTINNSNLEITGNFSSGTGKLISDSITTNKIFNIGKGNNEIAFFDSNGLLQTDTNFNYNISTDTLNIPNLNNNNVNTINLTSTNLTSTNITGTNYYAIGKTNGQIPFFNSNLLETDSDLSFNKGTNELSCPNIIATDISSNTIDEFVNTIIPITNSTRNSVYSSVGNGSLSYSSDDNQLNVKDNSGNWKQIAKLDNTTSLNTKVAYYDTNNNLNNSSNLTFNNSTNTLSTTNLSSSSISANNINLSTTLFNNNNSANWTYYNSSSKGFYGEINSITDLGNNQAANNREVYLIKYDAGPLNYGSNFLINVDYMIDQQRFRTATDHNRVSSGMGSFKLMNRTWRRTGNSGHLFRQDAIMSHKVNNIIDGSNSGISSIKPVFRYKDDGQGLSNHLSIYIEGQSGTDNQNMIISCKITVQYTGLYWSDLIYSSFVIHPVTESGLVHYRNYSSGFQTISLNNTSGWIIVGNSSSNCISEPLTSSTTNNVKFGIGVQEPQAGLHLVHNDVSGDCLRVDDILNDTTPFLIQNDGNVIMGGTTNINTSKLKVYDNIECQTLRLVNGSNNILSTHSFNESNILGQLYVSTGLGAKRIQINPTDQYLRIGGDELTNVSSSTCLHLEGTTQGFLPNRLTKIQKEGLTGVPGLSVFDTVLNAMSYYTTNNNWFYPERLSFKCTSTIVDVSSTFTTFSNITISNNVSDITYSAGNFQFKNIGTYTIMLSFTYFIQGFESIITVEWFDDVSSQVVNSSSGFCYWINSGGEGSESSHTCVSLNSLFNVSTANRNYKIRHRSISNGTADMANISHGYIYRIS